MHKFLSIALRPPANREFAYLFIVVLILGLGMAWMSAFNAHPDELSHVKAADYYAQQAAGDDPFNWIKGHPC